MFEHKGLILVLLFFRCAYPDHVGTLKHSLLEFGF